VQCAKAYSTEARDKGDLSENAEYDAKEAQGMLEMRITNWKKFILMQDL
jgi:transcription elongation factor GreA